MTYIDRFKLIDDTDSNVAAVDANGSLSSVLYDSSGNELDSVTNDNEDSNLDGKLGIVAASGIFARLNATMVKPIRMDASTHSIHIISHAHHKVHIGDFYRSGMNYTLSNGQVATFGFTTPDTTTWAHLAWDLSTVADGVFTLLEDVTSFSGGAAVTPLNHNRNSANTSVMTCIKGMTGADLITPTGGTTILNASLATGKGVVLSRASGEEFILKQNSNYLFTYTNGTSANNILLKLEWYEHSDRD